MVEATSEARVSWVATSLETVMVSGLATTGKATESEAGAAAGESETGPGTRDGASGESTACAAPGVATAGPGTTLGAEMDISAKTGDGLAVTT